MSKWSSILLKEEESSDKDNLDIFQVESEIDRLEREADKLQEKLDEIDELKAEDNIFEEGSKEEEEFDKKIKDLEKKYSPEKLEEIRDKIQALKRKLGEEEEEEEEEESEESKQRLAEEEAEESAERDKTKLEFLDDFAVLSSQTKLLKDYATSVEDSLTTDERKVFIVNGDLVIDDYKILDAMRTDALVTLTKLLYFNEKGKPTQSLFNRAFKLSKYSFSRSELDNLTTFDAGKNKVEFSVPKGEFDLSAKGDVSAFKTAYKLDDLTIKEEDNKVVFDIDTTFDAIKQIDMIELNFEGEKYLIQDVLSEYLELAKGIKLGKKSRDKDYLDNLKSLDRAITSGKIINPLIEKLVQEIYKSALDSRQLSESQADELSVFNKILEGDLKTLFEKNNKDPTQVSIQMVAEGLVNNTYNSLMTRDKMGLEGTKQLAGTLLTIQDVYTKSFGKTTGRKLIKEIKALVPSYLKKNKRIQEILDDILPAIQEYDSDYQTYLEVGAKKFLENLGFNNFEEDMKLFRELSQEDADLLQILKLGKGFTEQYKAIIDSVREIEDRKDNEEILSDLSKMMTSKKQMLSFTRAILAQIEKQKTGDGFSKRDKNRKKEEYRSRINTIESDIKSMEGLILNSKKVVNLIRVRERTASSYKKIKLAFKDAMEKEISKLRVAIIEELKKNMDESTGMSTYDEIKDAIDDQVYRRRPRQNGGADFIGLFSEGGDFGTIGTLNGELNRISADSLKILTNFFDLKITEGGKVQSLKEISAEKFTETPEESKKFLDLLVDRTMAVSRLNEQAKEVVKSFMFLSSSLKTTIDRQTKLMGAKQGTDKTSEVFAENTGMLQEEADKSLESLKEMQEFIQGFSSRGFYGDELKQALNKISEELEAFTDGIDNLEDKYSLDTITNEFKNKFGGLNE